MPPSSDNHEPHLSADVQSPSSVVSMLQDAFASQQYKQHGPFSSRNNSEELSDNLSSHELQGPPSAKSSYHNGGGTGAILMSSSNDRGSDKKNNAASSRSRIDAILTKSRQKRAQSRSRQKQHNSAVGTTSPQTPKAISQQRCGEAGSPSSTSPKCEAEIPTLPERKSIGANYKASLVDGDDDEANQDADRSDTILLSNDNIGKEVSSNINNTTSYPSPPQTPSGSRANNYGLVSILKGCTECGIDSDYLCDDDIIVVNDDGTTEQRRRRRFFQQRYTNACMNMEAPPSPNERTLSSRVSFSEELVVRELPQMSSEEKSRRFYTARELHNIRKDAREEKEMTAQYNDDCAFFCEDLYSAFCAENACASYGNACVDSGGDYIASGRYGY